MKPVTLFAAFILTALAYGQSPLIKQWDMRYGGTDDDYFYSFIQTRDQGYLLGGYSKSSISGDKTQAKWDTINFFYDYWVVKTDTGGNIKWDKRFGGYGNDLLYSVRQTSDAGYILGGYSTSSNSGDKTEAKWDSIFGWGDYWIVKIDSSGNKLWDKRFGGKHHETLSVVFQTPDGGYFLAGFTNSGISGDKTEANRDATNSTPDYWVVKTNALGVKLWDKRFGGNARDQLYDAEQTADGGYILCGLSWSGAGGDKSQLNWDPSGSTADYWIIKIDSLGSKQWDRRFGSVSLEGDGLLVQTSDGGFIAGGSSAGLATGDRTQTSWGAYDYWIVKMDSAGSKIWDKRYGGTDFDSPLRDIILLNDGSYLLGGASSSPAGGDKSENNLGMEQPWLMKIDSLGNKVWDKTLLLSSGNQSTIHQGWPLQTSDGSIVVAGDTKAGIGGYKTQPNWDPTNNTRDLWLIKFRDTTTYCNITASITADGPTNICTSDSVELCAPSNFADYQWNNGANTNCITTSLGGNYYVTVIDNNGCSAESNHLAVTVHPSPAVSVSINGDTLAAFNAAGYQWYIDGTAINGATSSIYVASQPGNNSVMVTDSNGCVAISSPIIFSGIAALVKSNALIIFPNPSKSGWELQVGNHLIGSPAEVSDANGHIVYQSTIPAQKSIINFEGPDGIYLLQVGSGETKLYMKLAKL